MKVAYNYNPNENSFAFNDYRYYIEVLTFDTKYKYCIYGNSCSPYSLLIELCKTMGDFVSFIWFVKIYEKNDDTNIYEEIEGFRV